MDQFKTKIDELTNVLSSYKEYNQVDDAWYKQAVEVFMLDFDGYKDQFKKQATDGKRYFSYKIDDRISRLFLNNQPFLYKIAEDYFSGSLKMSWSIISRYDEIHLHFIW